MKQIVPFFMLFFLWSCTVEPTVQENNLNDPDFTPEINPSGSYTFYHSGINRIYHYYEPSNLQDNAPLVFVLHGYSAEAEGFMNFFQMNALADEYGFAVVYPQGHKDNSGRTHWNAGLTISDVDDVAFLSALAQYLQGTYQLNREQTFSSGYSNGGFMSYELVIKKPEIFKAAASISGTMSLETWNNRQTGAPLPILQVSGELDRVVPISGMTNLYGGWGGAPEMAEIMTFWGAYIEADTETLFEQEGAYIKKYLNRENGNEVWYYLIQNLDHGIAMGINYDIHTPSLIWEFFSKY